MKFHLILLRKEHTSNVFTQHYPRVIVERIKFNSMESRLPRSCIHRRANEHTREEKVIENPHEYSIPNINTIYFCLDSPDSKYRK